MIRKLIAIAAFAAATLAPAVGLGAAPAYVTTDLNLRQGPGVEYPRYTTIPGGAAVEVLYCNEVVNWCMVGWRGMEGWVSAIYLAYVRQEVYRPAPPPVVVVPPTVEIYPDYPRYWYGQPRYRDRYYGKDDRRHRDYRDRRHRDYRDRKLPYPDAEPSDPRVVKRPPKREPDRRRPDRPKTVQPKPLPQGVPCPFPMSCDGPRG
ncbi:MAG: hypothetical protein BroJett030_07990 [Alphaproteobacteria bacterium]|nr:MAG: hypothetical protein BroJett030_07990 [Alphaproteobacteria bacterium]